MRTFSLKFHNYCINSSDLFRILINYSSRYEKQLKDLKDKGYFMMSDGTKSTDHEVPNKKKRAKSTDKKRGKSSTGKRKSVMDKSTDKGKKGKGVAASGKKSTKKSDDEDLDIESGSGNDDDSVENSA